MGKSRDLFKEIRDTKGTFHAKMVSIHRRAIQNDLHDPDNHDSVTTQLDPDVLECEVKWALGIITMIKASGCDGIPVELFQILKNVAVKVLYSIRQQIWKSLQWPQDWKRSVFHFNLKERQCQRMIKLPHSFTHFPCMEKKE